MPRHGPPYPEEFRREAVRLAKLGGKPRWKLAKELGITEVTLRKWLRQDTAEQEARREAEARARREGEENALPRARGQGALRPDSGAGTDAAPASDALSRLDDPAGSPPGQLSRASLGHGTTPGTANNDGTYRTREGREGGCAILPRAGWAGGGRARWSWQPA